MKKIFCFLVAVMMLFVSGCTSKQGTSNATQAPSSGDAGFKDTLVYAQGNDLTTLDASIGLQERAVALTNHMFDPLFMTDSNFKVAPNLASAYEWQDNGSTLKMTIRKNVKFHDGSDMNAKDVVFTLDLLNKRGAVFEDNYASSEAVDDYTVLLKLKHPNPAIPYILSMPQTCVIPSEYNKDTFAKNPIGTGPYKLKEAKEGDHYTIERFDGYWGEPAKTKYLTLRIIPEPAQRTIALETGDIDVAYSVPMNDVKRFQNDSKFKVLNGPSMKVVEMELNCKSTGPVGNPLVRRAIESAIDRKSIIDTLLNGFAKPSSSIVSFNAEEYRDTALNNYDPELAKKLMAEAGYANGFEVKLFTNADQINGEIAQVMQAQLAKVGIKLNITVQDDNTTFTMVESGQDFDMILDFFQTTSSHANDVFNNMLTSKSSNNYSRYFDNEFDSLYKQYASTAAGPEREALLKKIYEKIKNDVPAIALYVPYNMVVTSANVEGVYVSHIGAHEYQKATVKKTK